MIKLAHIIHPVIVEKSSDLNNAQPVTFRTMRIAKESAQNFRLNISLYTSQFPEDHSIIADYFKFAFVRNPYDWLISLYFYINNHQVTNISKK